jgi:hypothetical protein
MKVLKELTIFALGIIYFTIVCVPLAIVLFLTAHLYFETKRIIRWIKK